MLETAKSTTLDEAALKEVFSIFRNEKHLKIETLAGDASSRSYLRVTTGNASSGAKSFILQTDVPFEASQAAVHPYISALGLFHQLTAAVPQLVDFDAQRGWILLQDLGDSTLQKEPEERYYFDAIDLMNQWTVGALEYGQNFGSHKGPHFSWAFDFEKLNFEMEHTATFLVKEYLKEDPKEFLGRVLYNTNYLAARPRYLCHRDYHCRNLMVSKNKVWIIDFQDARMGPLTYDLVSLLWDPYVRLSQEFRANLMDRWQQGFLNSSQAAHFKNYFSNYWVEELERMKIQRLLKAAGSYASFLVKKGRKDYLSGIEPALRDSIEALENLEKGGWAREHDVELLTLLKRYLSNPLAIIQPR